MGQGVDCPLAVQVVSRFPVKPWTKQISIVVSAQSYNTSTPKDETGGGVWEDGPEYSVSGCVRGRLGRVGLPLLSGDSLLVDGLKAVWGSLRLGFKKLLSLSIVQATLWNQSERSDRDEA